MKSGPFFVEFQKLFMRLTEGPQTEDDFARKLCAQIVSTSFKSV